MAIVWKQIRMNSNTTPTPYVATASSAWGNQYQPFYAFTNTQKTSGMDCWATVQGQPYGWLQIDMGVPTRINAYQLTPRGVTNGGEYFASAPNSWQILGSNDGQNFELVDTRSGINNWSASVHYNTFELEEAVEYRYYRFNIVRNNGSTSYTCVGQWNFGYDEEEDKEVKLVVENTANNKAYAVNHKSPTLFELVNWNQDDIVKYGMKVNEIYNFDNVNITTLKTITRTGDTTTEVDTTVSLNNIHNYIGDNPNLIFYSEEVRDIMVDTIVDDYLFKDEISELNVYYASNDTTSRDVKLNVTAEHSPLDLLEGEFEVVTWVDGDLNVDVEITKRNKSSVATPITDINMNGISEIERFETSTVGDVRFTFSVDRGTTYKTFVNGQWVDVNDASEGFDEDTLVSLTNADMQALLGESYYLRIQYYLEGELATVDNIRMITKFLDYEVMADTAKYKVDYDIAEKTIKINFVQPSVYSISYMDSQTV